MPAWWERNSGADHALDLAGPGHRRENDCSWIERYFTSFGATICAGSSEIQRNIITEKVNGAAPRTGFRAHDAATDVRVERCPIGLEVGGCATLPHAGSPTRTRAHCRRRQDVR